MSAPVGGPVVVGSDGGATDSAAVRWAAEYAQRTGCGLRVVYASEPEVLAARAASAGPIDVGALLDAEEQRAQGVRERVAALAQELSIQAEVLLERGSPLRALLEHQDEAALLVVGTGRKRALEEFMLGTTSIGVAAHARCPVVVVNPEVEVDALDRGRVGVAIDGSEDSIAAGRAAIEYAARIGASVVAVTTWFLEMKDGYVITEPDSPEWQELEEERRDMVERALAGVRADHPEVPVQIEVRRGPTITVLREFSEEVDVLAIGSRGRGSIRGRLLGSISQRVMRSAVCPVLVATRPIGGLGGVKW